MRTTTKWAVAIGLVGLGQGTLAKEAPKHETKVERPVKLTPDELAAITAGKITEQRTNPGGHALPANSSAQGVAITVENVNPAGHAPPGQNQQVQNHQVSFEVTKGPKGLQAANVRPL
jgi:hypothetical protein